VDVSRDEVTTLRGAEDQAAGRRVATVGCLGLSLLCGALLTALTWWIGHAPSQPCPLPTLIIPRPGDLFAWSADGKRLLAGNRWGELWTVQFPGASVRALPPVRGNLGNLAWDDTLRWCEVSGSPRRSGRT
jgi:hypothetical protein